MRRALRSPFSRCRMSPTEIKDDRLYLVCPCGARMLIAERRWECWAPIAYLSERSAPWLVAHTKCLDKLA